MPRTASSDRYAGANRGDCAARGSPQCSRSSRARTRAAGGRHGDHRGVKTDDSAASGHLLQALSDLGRQRHEAVAAWYPFDPAPRAIGQAVPRRYSELHTDLPRCTECVRNGGKAPSMNFIKHRRSCALQAAQAPRSTGPARPTATTKGLRPTPRFRWRGLVGWCGGGPEAGGVMVGCG
jgi:hypothetical protein